MGDDRDALPPSEGQGDWNNLFRSDECAGVSILLLL
jgi:hypothetical protein